MMIIFGIVASPVEADQKGPSSLVTAVLFTAVENITMEEESITGFHGNLNEFTAFLGQAHALRRSPQLLANHLVIQAAHVMGPSEDLQHNDDVIMSVIASQITSLTTVYSTVYSDADQRKHQSSASLAFVWGIQRDRWIPRTKGQLRGKCFHLMTSSWKNYSMTPGGCGRNFKSLISEITLMSVPQDDKSTVVQVMPITGLGGDLA